MTRQLVLGLVMGFSLASALLMALTRSPPPVPAVHDGGSAPRVKAPPSLIDRVQVLPQPPSAMLRDGGA